MIIVIKHFYCIRPFCLLKEKNMKDLIEELLEIMDEECEECEEWQKNKPTIINIYIGGNE